MFFPEQQREEQETFRKVCLYENGRPDQQHLAFKLYKNKTTFRDIAKLYKLNHIRLFNSEGSECFQQDLNFVKNDSVLYVSRGEEFDPTSCFAEYQLLKLLGEGGFGKVYLAEHKQTKQKYAIKIIKTQRIGSVSDIDSIFVEAEILKSLKHQNIVEVSKCLTLKNMEVVIIMEFLEGGDLLKYLTHKKRLEEEEAKALIKQVVKGIEYCHQNNLTHRDLKLENILLVNSEEKKIKIIDFGIAGAISLTKWEQVDTGTMSYMAPECFLSQKNFRFDGKLDIWAIGVTLYALLCGELPFKGSSPHEIIHHIKEGTYKMPKQVELKLSHQCLNFLESCLDPDASTRISIEDLTNHCWLQEGIFVSEKKKKEVKFQASQEQEPAFRDITNKRHKREPSKTQAKSTPKLLSKRSSASPQSGKKLPAKPECQKSRFK